MVNKTRGIPVNSHTWLFPLYTFGLFRKALWRWPEMIHIMVIMMMIIMKMWFQTELRRLMMVRLIWSPNVRRLQQEIAPTNDYPWWSWSWSWFAPKQVDFAIVAENVNGCCDSLNLSKVEPPAMIDFKCLCFIVLCWGKIEPNWCKICR